MTHTDNATPRPCKIDGRWVVSDEGKSRLGQPIYEMLGGHVTDKDNAALIVRAVNSHDALVGALALSIVVLLQQVQNLLKSDQSDEAGRKAQIDVCLSQIEVNEKALALAKGGEV